MIKQGHPVKIVEKNGYPVIVQNIDEIGGGGGTEPQEPYELPREYKDWQTSLTFLGEGLEYPLTTQPVDLTETFFFLESFQGDSLIKYDSTNAVFKADPDTTEFYSFDFSYRFSGIFESLNEGIEFYIARPDGTKITGVTYTKGVLEDGNKVDFQLPSIKTFVGAGGNDKFQTEGFKVFARALETGVTLSGEQRFIISN